MKETDYILKKHVRASSAAEALELDKTTPVHEVYMISDKPDKDSSVTAVGFTISPEP